MSDKYHVCVITDNDGKLIGVTKTPNVSTTICKLCSPFDGRHSDFKLESAFLNEPDRVEQLVGPEYVSLRDKLEAAK